MPFKSISCLYITRALKLGVLSLIFFSWYSQAQEVAGYVGLATGTVSAVGTDGQLRTLKKGSEVYAGDRITTAGKSVCALQMIDDGKIIMRENSEIVLEEYSYNNQEDDSGVVELVKGGFRGLTGMIGKNNHDAYKVKSDVAVLGIRGTDYILIKD